MEHGDHNIYYKETTDEIIRAATLEDMRVQLRHLARQGRQSFLIPHHIGYRRGFRGINWADFTSEFSPVVEILSMHGLSESDEAPYPYLHVMGPRDSRSTMQHGLSIGNIFGVIGSSDHHSAHSGSCDILPRLEAGGFSRPDILRE
jgi:predicted DNA-binding protein with PD1-like motif